MKCIQPIQLGNNTVPCGKCNYCLQAKRTDWSFRLLQESKVCTASHFLTLTYDESNVPLGEDDQPTLFKRDMQLFTKRLRKEQLNHSSDTLRYYTVGEYGTITHRPHYHSIMFNLHPNTVNKIPEIWGLGHVQIGSCTMASIHYTTKYVINKVGTYEGREKPFANMSRRPGLGSNYMTPEMVKWHREDMRTFSKINGQLARLPRYYKDKIFSEDERYELTQQFKSEMATIGYTELQRLRKYHSDPSHYMQELIIENHDRITRSLNDKNNV